MTPSIIEAMLKASGKTQADLAVALGTTPEELTAMLATELSAADLERVAAAVVSMSQPSGEEGEEGEADSTGSGAKPEMVMVDVEGTAYETPKPVADLIEKLRAATSSATMRADAATRAATKERADAAAKLEGLVTRDQADAAVQSEATAIAELIDVTRRLRGAAFLPTPRMDAENKELPLRRRDWEQAVLLAHYGDEEGAARVAQLDAKSTEAARRERFDDFMHEIRKGIADKDSKINVVRQAIADSSRALSDSAPADADSRFAAAKAAAAQRAAGQPVTTN
jgi:hypothetical protein